MVRCSVLVVLSLIVVACALPSPKGPKVTLVKNSDLGLGVAAAGSQTNGVQSENSYGQEKAAPRPQADDDDAPEFAVVDNVNVGGAAAVGDSSAAGVVKQNSFASTNPFG